MYIGPLPPSASETAMYAETLEQFQHTIQLNPEGQSYYKQEYWSKWNYNSTIPFESIIQLHNFLNLGVADDDFPTVYTILKVEL